MKTRLHGNSLERWFFATSRAEGDSLPHCPCEHRHRTFKDSRKCATKRGNTHVREVTAGILGVHEAIADHEV